MAGPHGQPQSLAGKVAIVTGGAAGIGRAIAQLFLAQGARVVVADIDADSGATFARESGPAARFLRADVSSAADVRDLVRYAVDTFGGLQVMVNNAGISGPLVPSFLDDDLGDFDRILRVNLLGVMLGTQHAARHMATHGGGSIINISSVGGIQAGGAVMTYRASKAGVIQFSKSVAIELGRHDIRVNCLAPGNILTTMLSGSVQARPGDDGQAGAVRDMIRELQPLLRQGTPDDVAAAAAYFAGDASRYVTGTVLPIDGGMTTGLTSRLSAAPAPHDSTREPSVPPR